MTKYISMMEKETNKTDSELLSYNKNYVELYKLIEKKVEDFNFMGPVVDIGCGLNYFSKACNTYGIECRGIDFDDCNLESDKLPFEDNSLKVVHLNAVIEHINNTTHLIDEIKRVLQVGGAFILNTPNFQIDYKNFYNDPTHIKPYTPESLRRLMIMHNLEIVFLEPAIINLKKVNYFGSEISMSEVYWMLPNESKWVASANDPRGSKSILCVAIKRK